VAVATEALVEVAVIVSNVDETATVVLEVVFAEVVVGVVVVLDNGIVVVSHAYFRE
jgi:hypothetical protein